jgi:PDZ domain-containing secreted protein
MFDDEQEVFDAFDEWIDSVKDEILSEDSKVMAINPLKVKQMQFVYAVLKRCATGSDVKISYKMNEPFKSMGSVSVEGNELVFTEAKWMARAVEFASNVEIYPLADERVRMTFTFHGIAKSIE